MNIGTMENEQIILDANISAVAGMEIKQNNKSITKPIVINK